MPKKSKAAEYAISPPLQRLREKYPDHPALKEEAIYALPRDLITEIEKERKLLTREVRKFFTVEEAQFEIDLAEASGGGFFLGQPFGYLSLSKPPVGDSDPELDRRCSGVISNVRQMLADDREAAGFDRKAVEAAMYPDRKPSEKIRDRREGYAGWLVTSAAFRAQRDAICRAFHGGVKELGRFPSFEPSAMGEAPDVPEEQVNVVWNCREFYETWGLHRMLTWDLPVPMRPEWSEDSGFRLPHISGKAGLVVFVPWYLARHQDLKIENLVDRKLALQSPPQIREWLQGKPKGWGPDRFAMMLRIYIYLELALKRRYPEKIRGFQKRLDTAFARFLSRDLDDEASGWGTIDKIRRQMNARLKKKR